MVTPNDISNKKFEKAALGYRPDQVDLFLQEVANSYVRVAEENKQLEKKIQVLAEKIQEYRELEDSLKETLLTAQRLGDTLLKESKLKADAILRDATAKADSIVENARKKLEGEQLTLTRMQREVSGFKSRLTSLYKTHLELISALPDYQEELPEPAVESIAQSEPAQIPEAAPAAESAEINTAVEESPAVQNEAVSNDASEPTFHFVPKSGSAEHAPSETETPKNESRFGPLKFGDDYDIKRDGQYQRTGRRKR